MAVARLGYLEVIVPGSDLSDSSESLQDSDSDWAPYGLAPQSCAVCRATSSLLCCVTCQVVSYCGAAHQAAHRPKHEEACAAIARTRQSLGREEAALRAHPGDVLLPAPVFTKGVGRFWALSGTRDYMRARFAAATALLNVDTLYGVEQALEHLTDMLRLCRADNLGVRDIIPNLLLRLGREQECYDFLKRWATADPDGRNDSANVQLPHLDTRGSDAFEPVDALIKNASLGHLVSLTLLKLRLFLDCEACEDTDPFEFTSGIAGIDRPIGKLVRKKARRLDPLDILEDAGNLQRQYLRLCREVHERNPYLWDVLLDETTPSPPPFYAPGSREEAELVVYQCKCAWDESCDALVMIESDTSKFVSVYTSPTNPFGGGGGDAASERPSTIPETVEKRRGTGVAFPSRFVPPLPTIVPEELFPATALDHGQPARFIHRQDAKKVLVFTDGACPNNGQAGPRAGWGVVYSPSDRDGSASGRLERKGPFGKESVATSNRAELRAIIGALRLCDWAAQGFDSIVIATDSSYAVDGGTSWAKGWVRREWVKSSTRTEVKNRDLWELLLGEVERWSDLGVHVALWQISREMNTRADAVAKEAAGLDSVELVDFSDVRISSPRKQASPRVLFLCFEYEAMFEDMNSNLVAQIAPKAQIERFKTPADAMAKLRTPGQERLVIFVADASPIRHRELWERIIDHLRLGATVVLAGCFSSVVSGGQFDRCFAKLGLPWERSSYHRTTVSLRPSAVDAQLRSRLPTSYSQKAVFVKNVAPSAAWYTDSDSPHEAAVAFTQVGRGKLGYMGDVNCEVSSEAVVLAMCGLMG